MHATFRPICPSLIWTPLSKCPTRIVHTSETVQISNSAETSHAWNICRIYMYMYYFQSCNKLELNHVYDNGNIDEQTLLQVEDIRITVNFPTPLWYSLHDGTYSTLKWCYSCDCHQWRPYALTVQRWVIQPEPSSIWLTQNKCTLNWSTHAMNSYCSTLSD